ncbi:hypothetical protein [Streptomyces sp. NPDC051921]|uniref:hypothetical protein n=1 Tax=Streptomyces sp. NPDC051921 TaxID=3155806 RepID=UPI0034320925
MRRDRSRPRGRAVGLPLVVGLLTLAAGAYFLAGTIQATRDLDGGVRTTAVLVDEPSHCSDACRVTFDAADSTVVAKLPAHELIRKFHRGSDLSIVYAPQDPRRIALADSVGPGPVLLASLVPSLGLALVIASAAVWIRARPRRSWSRTR